MRVEREEFFRSLLQKRSDELLINAQALVARMEVELPEGDDAAQAAGQCKIDTNCPPKNFKDAMLRTDRQEWAEAYDKEYQGFKSTGPSKSSAQCQESRLKGAEPLKRRRLVAAARQVQQILR